MELVYASTDEDTAPKICSVPALPSELTFKVTVVHLEFCVQFGQVLVKASDAAW